VDFFHSIAIEITPQAVYPVIMAFDLEKSEPNIDFPIACRVTLATIIGSVGVFFYLRSVLHSYLAAIPPGG
jgi:hypothetical protein